MEKWGCYCLTPPHLPMQQHPLWQQREHAGATGESMQGPLEAPPDKMAPPQPRPPGSLAQWISLP